MLNRTRGLFAAITVFAVALLLLSCGGSGGEKVGPPMPSGTLALDVTPDSINAPWVVTGPSGYSNTGNGDATLQNLDPGSYEVCWQAVEGWNLPDPSCESAEVASGATTTVVGTYSEISAPPSGFVAISAGTFVMGSPDTEPQRESNETQHTVTLSGGFYMSKYEVTEQWWADVMGEAPTTSRLPKVNVSWDMAVQFCNALSQREGLTPAYTIHGPNGNVTWNRDANGYRLPTEAEWEYACRAGTTAAFNNGTNCLSADTEANYDGNYPLTGCPSGAYRDATVEVGSFPANAWGLYDMHGNVWEWCYDWFEPYSGDATDPQGPSSASVRVFRGGSWLSRAQYCRSAHRSYSSPGLSDINVGFRPVRSAF